jgi:hypothetical protein
MYFLRANSSLVVFSDFKTLKPADSHKRKVKDIVFMPATNEYSSFGLDCWTNRKFLNVDFHL